ncbi:protein kinase containing Z-DNA binding domains [Denticeps clupeoides]|uniref:protein kinase containing Z-DNA binding domains n=1 Tax=Denticeps clupeoides TaxID=299321 RepID=UPI0010A2F82A|nr:interferon-induced, double-stranded RNA-activated protein kinase-like [Denticeps clupeoides]
MAERPGGSLEDRIGEHFRKNPTQAFKALDVARAVGLKTAKDVNPTLYALSRNGRLVFTGETPPLWSLGPKQDRSSKGGNQSSYTDTSSGDQSGSSGTTDFLSSKGGNQSSYTDTSSGDQSGSSGTTDFLSSKGGNQSNYTDVSSGDQPGSSDFLGFADGTLDTATGLSLKDFDQINEIGSGGYGNVYKAKHKMDGMFYALKIVKYTSQAESEVKNLARCDHQNIVRYYTAWKGKFDWNVAGSSKGGNQSSYTDTSSGDQSGSSGTTDFLAGPHLFIQMEFCENGTLTTWIEDRNYRNSQRNAEDALTVFKQVVCGVMYIHSQRLIHRDLKPDNILFEKNGDVKIGDFGLVTMITDESGGSVERTLAKGTQSYMSPEQKDRRSYDEKTDIFPLGLIFFELLWKFSTRLEKAKTWENLRKQEFPDEFSEDFNYESKLIKKMLSREPRKRPAAAQLKAALDAGSESDRRQKTY